MMATINNQRPGVYSRYDVTSAYAAPRSAKYAAVAARAADGVAGELWEFTAPGQLAEAFGPDSEGSTLRGCVQILLQSGVTKVYAVAVGEDGYAAALGKLEKLANVGAVVCDCAGPEDRDALRRSVQASCDAQRERIGFCGVDKSAGAIVAAQALNSERVVLCCPAVQPAVLENRCAAYAAAAMAGKVLAVKDPVWNFNSEPLEAVRLPDALEENEVQALLAAGVTVLEAGSGGVECVRALTTRTKTNGETDYMMRAVNTILCIDDVMQAVRAALKATLRGSRLGSGSLDAIRAQTVVALADRADSGVIESYEAPRVTAHSEDPTVCIVELSFAVANVVHQIHVTAHIQV